MTNIPPASRRGPAKARSTNLLVPAIALVAALGLALAAFAGGGDEPTTAPDDAPTGEVASPSTAPAADDRDAQLTELLSQLERRQAGDPLAIGEPDAPVLMIEWADFQCPFCGSFARDTKPELLARYVEDGTLRIEWRDLPMLGPESQTAALAGRAAAEQDAFWAFHDAVFADERPVNSGELEPDRLLALAGDLGLDVERFEADLDDPAAAEAIRADREWAQSLGITGTPAFLINGQLLIGGQPTEVFAQAIEQMAAEAAG
ncbi:MAG TPA: thioredoxin domain-containing protein [Egicoccus sp.]|nr:thioredoxin domain-containing protein [Egicoccus sp.]HSK24865.1 thioredoxin domain-containing protein [Egicoccus sp.]